ncbi:MAG: ABC transporter ATP-binding protein/permease [Desulfobulbaceae bacterium]|nr:ABC transporter ATP-binding protein/permease [Desulfobulbaceae bacterium]
MRRGFGYFEEEQLNKVGDITLWQRILSLIGRQWPWVAIAIIFALVSVGSGLTLPHLMQLAIDRFIVNQTLPGTERIAGLGRLSLFFLGLSLLGFMADFLQSIALEWAGQKTMHRLRQQLFSRLLDLDLAFFNNNPGGKLVTRLTNDIQNMNEMFSSVIVTLFNDTLRLIGILVVLFFMNWRLAAILALLLPLIFTNIYWFSRLARDVSRLIRTVMARFNSYLQESLSGLSIIQLLKREPTTLDGFVRLNNDYLELSRKQIRIFAIFMPMTELFSSLAIAMIIWYGGGEILQDRMSLGMLVAFLAYMRLFFQPVRELSQKYSIVQSAMSSAERIFQLVDTDNTLPIASNPLQPKEVIGKVCFDNVSFGYLPDHPVLHNFNLTIEAGSTVAIVGATGSGKTTIINLLERFYDPTHGQVLLDNINLCELDQQWLRNQIGLVMQDVLIIPGTVRDNILLDHHLTNEELAQILTDAQLNEMIGRLPDGLETIIGEGGQTLSSGQNQLLALARILARNPRVLVLDEATANVDSATEILIERAIATTLANRTSIVIAHRLSTIRRADRIIVLDNGRIIEQGSHSQLMADQGHYHQMQQHGKADIISN